MTSAPRLPLAAITQRILALREHEVLPDSDLAALYGFETCRLNEQVRRNQSRFAEDSGSAPVGDSATAQNAPAGIIAFPCVLRNVKINRLLQGRFAFNSRSRPPSLIGAFRVLPTTLAVRHRPYCQGEPCRCQHRIQATQFGISCFRHGLLNAARYPGPGPQRHRCAPWPLGAWRA